MCALECWKIASVDFDLADLQLADLAVSERSFSESHLGTVHCAVTCEGAPAEDVRATNLGAGEAVVHVRGGVVQVHQVTSVLLVQIVTLYKYSEIVHEHILRRFEPVVVESAAYSGTCLRITTAWSDPFVGMIPSSLSEIVSSRVCNSCERV